MNQVEEISKLHNRHLARLYARIDRLENISIKNIKDCIKQELSFYTNDVLDVIAQNKLIKYEKKNYRK